MNTINQTPVSGAFKVDVSRGERIGRVSSETLRRQSSSLIVPWHGVIGSSGQYGGDRKPPGRNRCGSWQHSLSRL